MPKGFFKKFLGHAIDLADEHKVIIGEFVGAVTIVSVGALIKTLKQKKEDEKKEGEKS